MEIADIRRAIPKHADGDIVIAGILISQRQSGGDGQMRADDSVPAPKVLLHIRHMHRTALTLRAAGGFA